MLWHRRRRSVAELTQILEQSRASAITYEPIGGSLDGPAPAGLVRRSWRRALDGDDAFECARDAIRGWSIHRARRPRRGDRWAARDRDERRTRRSVAGRVGDCDVPGRLRRRRAGVASASRTGRFRSTPNAAKSRSSSIGAATGARRSTWWPCRGRRIRWHGCSRRSATTSRTPPCSATSPRWWRRSDRSAADAQRAGTRWSRLVLVDPGCALTLCAFGILVFRLTADELSGKLHACHSGRIRASGVGSRSRCPST